MNRLLLLIFAAALTMPAHGGTLMWTLIGVSFDDGGTASGSFGYDFDTNTFSSVSITTTAGSALTGNAYTALNPTSSSNIQILLITSPLGPGFTLTFSSGLSNFGGAVPLVSGAEGTCADVDCGGLNSPLRFLSAGEVQADVVPEPASWMLLLSGVALAGAARRRVSRRQE